MLSSDTHSRQCVDMALFDLINLEGRVSRYESDMFLPRHKPSRSLIQEIADSPEPPPRPRPLKMKVNRMLQPVAKPDPRSVVVVNSSRPVQRPQDMPSTPLPATPPSLSSATSLPAAEAHTPAQTVLIPPEPLLVQPPSGPVSVTQVASGVGKPVPVQNSQAVYSGAQRFILTPDMQARLPTGEVISLSQLASLSGRPLQSPSVTKPLTLQLQGAKLTLSGAQMRPLGIGQPRPVQGNVLHLVSSGGQHHLLSQPAQLALIQALAQQAAAPAASAPSQLVQNSAPSQMGVQTVSVQSLQHTLLNSANIPASAAAGIAPPGQAPGLVKIVVRQTSREVPASPQRPPQASPVRPLLRVMPGPHAEQVNVREGLGERPAPVVVTSTITLANSSLLMVSSPALASRLPSPNPVPLSTEDSPVPPMSGVALRLLTTGTSTMQLTNHHSSPPRHTQSPALPNSSPCPMPNCTTAQIVGPDCGPCTVVFKPQNPDPILTDVLSVQNGNGLQRQESAAVPASPSLTPNICVPSTCSDSALYVNLTPNPPSPPASSIPKLTPPTYNLSLVPALLANSAPPTVSSYNPIPARFLTSPVSLLTLSPLPSTNSGTAPVLYTHPSATTFPTLAAPTLSAPLPATSVSATLPLLAAPVSGQLAPFATHLPISTASKSSLSACLSAPHPVDIPVPAPRPLLSAPAGAPRPLLSAPAGAPRPLLSAPAGAPRPVLSAPAGAPRPVLSAPAGAPRPVLSAPAGAPRPVLSAPAGAPRPVLSAPAGAPRPVLSAPAGAPRPVLSAPTPLPTATASLLSLEASSNQPLLLAPDSAAMPLLEASVTDTLPPLMLNTSLKIPSVASAPLPVLPASSTVPILAAAASSKFSLPLLNVTTTSSTLPLLAQAPPATFLTPSSTCAPQALSPSFITSASSHSMVTSIRSSTSPASLTFATSGSFSSIVTSSSPLSSTPHPVPAKMLFASSVPTAAHANVLPTSALEPSAVSTLVAPVPHIIPNFSQSPLPSLPVRIPAPLPSASTQSLSVPASAPAPLPSLPASTPIPLPLLPASTPAPVSSLPASPLDPTSLLLVSAPAPNLSSSVHASTQPVEPAPLLPPSAHPLVISVSAPLTLTASSPASTPMPLLASHVPAPLHTLQSSAATLRPCLSSSIPVPKSVPLPSSPQSTSAPQCILLPPNVPFHTPNTDSISTVPTSVNIPVPAIVQEQSLSLSIAGPPAVSVTIGTPAESDVTLERDESRSTHISMVPASTRPRRQLPPPPRSPFYVESLEERRRKQKVERLERVFHLNERRCSLAPIYGTEVLRVCTLHQSALGLQDHRLLTNTLSRITFTPQQRLEQLHPLIERFIFAMPPVEAPQISLHTSHPPPSVILQESVFKETLSRELTPHSRCLHRIIANMRTQFPDLRLIQYDCGKLQTLDRLLRQLKSGGHRVLIFTQMTRMLDVLEQFLNYHGHIYVRLDGSTRVEQRQVLMERFNMDKRIFSFILSTRSGGVGVNLTGADTVIFYDSDWNPTMDAQAQDRCHRIGQTRDVHIYRLVSERTVEENILKKAQQKRMLGDMAIEGGNFTTAYFKQHTIRELFDMEDTPRKDVDVRGASPDPSTEDGSTAGQAQILEQALCGAEDEEDTLAASLVRAEQVADLAEFNENIPLEPEEEEQSRAEQEISALVEQLTPIERYAMYFLEASLEEVSKEELKQAEEQVEAARKDLFLAKDEGGQIAEEKWDEEIRKNRKVRTPTPGRPSERVGIRMSERLRGTRVTEITDATESLTNPDAVSPAQDIMHSGSPQTLTDMEGPSHVTETSNTTTVVSEPPTAPPSVHPENTATEREPLILEETVGDAVLVEAEDVSVPGETMLASPVSVPQEENGTPRTPRRKVTADCEILLAGASESSPTAKVLRRLPGRLVTVLQERLPTPRRHSRGRVQQPTTDNGTQSPNIPDSQSPSHEILSEENSETGSPPPKRKRGRPPKTRSDMSHTGVPFDMSMSPVESPQVSPECDTSPQGTTSELGTSSLGVQTPGSPTSTFRLNSESESGSPIEKRKRGRPPKRREASPVVASPTSPVVASPTSPFSLHGDSAPDICQSDTTAANCSRSDHKENDLVSSTLCCPTSNAIIPSESSNIPVVGAEGTSSSGVDEPVTPPKRKRGRPPKSHSVPKVSSSSTSHNDRLDSSPDRSPSPQITRTPLQRKLKPPKSDNLDTREHNSSPTDTDDSSGDEIVIRTPLTRSARTRMQTTTMPPAISKNSGASSNSPRGRSPRSVNIQEKPSNKRRKPPSVSSPSPPSSSPHDSSSERQHAGSRKRHCPPAERVLRSSLTANPASNTRSSRPPLLNSPNSHRGRKAKT
ncbi:uncharacterized protein LOC142097116 isoform X2 [Mixophyes fleayi]|uniref:uncharacterized protein LOC142097116 isoform X2 n=1 Tax=Mixophyes fleayi TaxID=3061075 RepID=UPI003F4DC703